MDRMHFMGELDGFQVPLDAKEEVGGQGKGMHPNELSLTSLAGYTAMNVINILRKMKIESEPFTVDLESEATEEHPRIFASKRLTNWLKTRLKNDKIRVYEAGG